MPSPREMIDFMGANISEERMKKLQEAFIAMVWAEEKCGICGVQILCKPRGRILKSEEIKSSVGNMISIEM